MPSKKDVQPKKKPQTKSDKVYDYFVGTMVGVILNDVHAADQSLATSNLTIEGLLLDQCDEYIYLGSESEVNTAIKKSSISMVISADLMGHKEPDIKVPPGSIQQ